MLHYILKKHCQLISSIYYSDNLLILSNIQNTLHIDITLNKILKIIPLLSNKEPLILYYIIELLNIYDLLKLANIIHDDINLYNIIFDMDINSLILCNFFNAKLFPNKSNHKPNNEMNHDQINIIEIINQLLDLINTSTILNINQLKEQIYQYIISNIFNNLKEELLNLINNILKKLHTTLNLLFCEQNIIICK